MLNFLDNRLHFSADYYKKNTKDMLLALEIPHFIGYDNPEVNAGNMHTTGYDIEVGWRDKVGDFTYSISVCRRSWWKHEADETENYQHCIL